MSPNLFLFVNPEDAPPPHPLLFLHVCHHIRAGVEVRNLFPILRNFSDLLLPLRVLFLISQPISGGCISQCGTVSKRQHEFTVAAAVVSCFNSMVMLRATPCQCNAFRPLGVVPQCWPTVQKCFSVRLSREACAIAIFPQFLPNFLHPFCNLSQLDWTVHDRNPLAPAILSPSWPSISCLPLSPNKDTGCIFLPFGARQQQQTTR